MKELLKEIMELEVEIFDVEFEVMDVRGRRHICVHKNGHLNPHPEDKFYIEDFIDNIYGWTIPVHYRIHESVIRLDKILESYASFITKDRETVIPKEKIVRLENPRKINFRTGRFTCHQEVIEGSLFKRQSIRNVYQFVTEKKEDK